MQHKTAHKAFAIPELAVVAVLALTVFGALSAKKDLHTWDMSSIDYAPMVASSHSDKNTTDDWSYVLNPDSTDKKIYRPTEIFIPQASSSKTAR